MQSRIGTPVLFGILFLLLTSSLGTVVGTSQRAEESPPPEIGEDLCPNRSWHHGMGVACRHVDGLWEIFAPDGRSLGLTHGPDPIPPPVETIQVMNPRDPACAADPVNGHFGIIIYARAHDDVDRFAEMEPQIRDTFRDINGHLYDNAMLFGRERDFIMHCTGGEFTIRNEVLPTNMADAGFDTIVSDLQDLGYDSFREKYWIWYDDTGACTCGGLGHIWGDERLTLENRNNGAAAGGTMYGVTFGYLGIRVMMHENGHNLGAVQLGSPNASGGWHCNDGEDIMCYDDGGSTSNYDPNVCATEDFDCGHDDYFHPNPDPGQWLATHWNLGSDLMRYHAFNHPPTVDALTCTPEPGEIGQATTCTFSATDDSAGIAYTVDWGDGSSTTRVPTSGFVAPGSSRNADHTFAAASTYTIRVTAVDNDGVAPRTSAERIWSHSVSPPNDVPTMQSLSCTPNSSNAGDEVTCTFRATDDSSGVHYTVQWGDGSPTTRVPASGSIAPGTTETAQHTYASQGSYSVSVTATDNEAPPLTSSAIQHLQSVLDPNDAPVMDSLSCSPNPSSTGQVVTCEFVAEDDSGGVYYDIDWGDGSASERAPASGYALPGALVSLQHAWSGAGAFTVSVTATDNDEVPLTGSALVVTQSVDLTNQVPVMDSLSCSPAPSGPGDPVTCTFQAGDDSSGVHYTVDWGDGSGSTRVPSAGTVSPGTSQGATHSFGSVASVVVSVTATDNAAAPATSSARNLVHEVIAPNQAPAMEALSCAPADAEVGDQVQCSFHATDDSTGVQYSVDWGDGTPTTQSPTSGYAAPGSTIVAGHTFASPGTYTIAVTATDSDPNPLSSAVLSVQQTIDPANDPPLMHSLNCSPLPAAPQEPVTCTMRANDDSEGVTYTVDWGDGSATELVPPAGTATPGVSMDASHVYADVGTYIVSASATDTGGLTSGTLTIQVEIRAPNAVPIMDLLSCDPTVSEAGDPVSCQMRASDDSGGLHFTVDWGDGSSLQRVPATGFIAPGGTMAPSHTWNNAGTYTVRVTATDNDPAPASSIELSLAHEVIPPCVFDRMGSLTIGLGGIETEGTSARWEGGLPPACQGSTFLLTGSTGSDFNVCWYAQQTQLTCHTATGNDSGIIPAGADRARVIYFTGSAGEYRLRAL